MIRRIHREGGDQRAAARTTLTFTVDGCEGCEVQLVNARSTLDADVVHVWESQTKEVSDGTVTFRIPTRRTWGMSATVRAPSASPVCSQVAAMVSVTCPWATDRSFQPSLS